MKRCLHCHVEVGVPDADYCNSECSNLWTVADVEEDVRLRMEVFNARKAALETELRASGVSETDIQKAFLALMIDEMKSLNSPRIQELAAPFYAVAEVKKS